MYLLAVCYLFLPRLTIGGTVGYRVMRIQYAAMFEGKDRWLNRVNRMLWAALLLFGFLLDHFWILFDEHR